MVLHFSSNLVFPLTNISFFKWFEQIQLEGYMVKSKGLAMHNVLVLGIRRIVCALFHDAKVVHTFININKQLK